LSLSKKTNTLCSRFEDLVQATGFATTSLAVKRAIALSAKVSPDARERDVKTPSEGVE